MPPIHDVVSFDDLVLFSFAADVLELNHLHERAHTISKDMAIGPAGSAYI